MHMRGQGAGKCQLSGGDSKSVASSIIDHSLFSLSGQRWPRDCLGKTVQAATQWDPNWYLEWKLLPS